MNIVFLAHMWCPVHNAGGETTAHSAMRAMVRRGHNVTVICRPQSEAEGAKFQDYDYEGVSIVKCPINTAQDFVRWYVPTLDPDLLITHLDLTSLAMQLSIELLKPLAHWVHNTMSFDVFKVTPQKCQLAIFNSYWVAEHHKWFDPCCDIPECEKCGGTNKKQRPQIVIHPTVEPERYRCERGTKITLVNPTPGKGADTFYALAQALPEREFLVVKSVYGEQIAPPNISPSLHPNVETMEHTSDIREVFRKTKILLMPSEYESYGRVAVEAACCGIPTIAHPTEGLIEALDDAGLFYHRLDAAMSNFTEAKRQKIAEMNPIYLEGWKGEVERLLTDDVYYRKRSDMVLELAGRLDPESEFDRLENALLVTSDTWERTESMRQSRMWTSDRRLYKWPDGSIHAEMKDGSSLYCAVGGQIALAEAELLGLVDTPKQTVTTTPIVDEDVEWAKRDHKRMAEAEGKMIAGPEENKANKPQSSKSKKAA